MDCLKSFLRLGCLLFGGGELRSMEVPVLGGHAPMTSRMALSHFGLHQPHLPCLSLAVEYSTLSA